MRIFSTLLCIVSAFVLGGCAAGNKVDYRGTSSFTAPAAKGVMALGAQDERPYVVNGGKQANYVGMTRSLYGIPFNTATTSGEPLADEIGSLVASTLRKNGSTVTEVKLPVGASSEGRIALFKPANAIRSYLIEIREWLTDTYMSAALTYDISLSVIDNSGAVLATKNARGDDIKLGSRPDFANLATAVSTIFGGLLNDPAIVSASGGGSTPSTVAASPNTSAPQSVAKAERCSVEQILEMKRVALPEDRIKAACQ